MPPKREQVRVQVGNLAGTLQRLVVEVAPPHDAPACQAEARRVIDELHALIDRMYATE